MGEWKLTSLTRRLILTHFFIKKHHETYFTVLSYIIRCQPYHLHADVLMTT